MLVSGRVKLEKLQQKMINIQVEQVIPVNPAELSFGVLKFIPINRTFQTKKKFTEVAQQYIFKWFLHSCVFRIRGSSWI